MKRLAALVALGWIFSLPALGAAESPALGAQHGAASLSQDPLMQQIRRRQLLHPNGGVTAAVRIASGQSIPLEVKDAGDPLGGLQVHPGLLAERQGPKPASRKGVRRAAAQLKRVETGGHDRAW